MKMQDEFFNKLKNKISMLKKEMNKQRLRDLIIDIIVDLEKFCHMDKVQIHRVLADARKKCREEIDKS